jgi:glucokinase
MNGPAPDPGGWQVLGIDVGGTKIALGVVDFPRGEILAKRVVPTRCERGGDAALDDVVQAAQALTEEVTTRGGRVTRAGVGICELVDPAGEIRSAHSLAWTTARVRARLAAWAPLTLEADVRAAALAESFFGAGRGLPTFLYLTIGTGISCCLMLQGRPLVGANGATGTLASSPRTFECERCGHRHERTLEDVAAGPGLVRGYGQRSASRGLSSEEVLAAATRGDPVAKEVVRGAVEALGCQVGLLINVLDPHAVVVGGGLGMAEGPYWEGLVTATRRHVWSEVHRDLPIVHARTGADAGLIGAATGAWQEGLGGTTGRGPALSDPGPRLAAG